MTLLTEPQEATTVRYYCCRRSTSTKDLHNPQDLICYSSLFFKAAFKGEFAEGQSQTMSLDEVNSEVFGLLVHWLYTREIFLKGLKVVDGQTIIQETLAALWFLTDQLIMPLL